MASKNNLKLKFEIFKIDYYEVIELENCFSLKIVYFFNESWSRCIVKVYYLNTNINFKYILFKGNLMFFQILFCIATSWPYNMGYI